MDLGLKLKIAFHKYASFGIKWEDVWIGEALRLTKKTGWTRKSVPYFKFLHCDLKPLLKNQNMNWHDMSNKESYSRLYRIYGGIFPYKHLDTSDYDQCIKASVLLAYYLHFCDKIMENQACGGDSTYCCIKWHRQNWDTEITGLKNKNTHTLAPVTFLNTFIYNTCAYT